jgi:hypothetical protein
LYQKSKYEIKREKNPILWYRADQQKRKTEYGLRLRDIFGRDPRGTVKHVWCLPQMAFTVRVFAVSRDALRACTMLGSYVGACEAKENQLL